MLETSFVKAGRHERQMEDKTLKDELTVKRGEKLLERKNG